MLQKKRTLRHFGIEEKGEYRGPQHEYFIQDIKDAIEENQQTALIGSFGSGKSTIGRMAVRDLMEKDDEKYRFVYVDSADLEKLSAGQILHAMITDLSSESVRKSTQARSRQARRIVGDLVQMGKKVCLFIDNAHRLHPNVLMALKDEHEKHYLGYDHVFSIVYVGQEKLLGKLSTYKEVFWRVLVLNMADEDSQWMNFQERKNYLEAVYGPAISPVARERIAKKTSKPLEMEFYLREKMEEAKAAGKEQLDEEVVELTLRQRRESLGASLKDVADKAGVGKTTVHDVEEGKPSTKKDDVQAALREMEKEATKSTNDRRPQTDDKPKRKAS